MNFYPPQSFNEYSASVTANSEYIENLTLDFDRDMNKWVKYYLLFINVPFLCFGVIYVCLFSSSEDNIKDDKRAELFKEICSQKKAFCDLESGMDDDNDDGDWETEK